MALTRSQKETILNDLRQAFESAKGIAFARYSGLTVEAFQELRKNLRSKGVQTKVAKKTLIKIAAKEKNLDIPDEILDGPIAVAFSTADEIAGAQELFKFSKKNEAIQLTGGVNDGKVIDKEMVTKLAQLPGREELLAKLLGSLNAPVSNFHHVLQGTLRDFIQVCKQISEKK